jgi:NADPH2:quinone reductase
MISQMSEHAIRFSQNGGPEVLQYEPVDLPPPGSGEVRLRHTAIGLNFVDVYQRTGLYPTELPATLGNEAAGVVEELGPDVSGLAVGDRVAYATASAGAYSTARNVAAEHLVPVPDGVSDEAAAAVLLKGLTVWYLIRRTYPVKAGETVLWHAAAGGVGLIAGQWLRHIGVRTIGTAGSAEKAKLAAANGCDETILYRDEDFAARVRELTGGEGVPVVYDSVGKDTFEGSLDSLRPRGLLVSFGNASGPVTGVSLATLASKGSLFVTRATMAHYVFDPAERATGAAELLELVAEGVIDPNVCQRYPLADAGEAQAALESRATQGATILLP